MPISTSIQGSLSLGVNGGFGWALRLPAGAQWVTTENGTKYVTKTINGKEYRLYKFGTFDFTPVDIDTSAPIGALAGTFDVSSPGGYPVTLTTTDPNFSISGASLLVAVPLQPVAYYVKATATDPNGWKWQKLFVINVDAAPVLQDVTFSKPLFQGVALSGVVIEGVAVGATVTLNNGLTADYSVRPVTASGTPTTAGLNATAIVQTLGDVTKTTPYTFGPGIPANTSPPTIPAAPQVGVQFGTPRGTGVVLGPNDGAFTNNPTSRAVQHMRVAPGAAAGTYGTAIPTSEGGALDVRVPNANDLGFQFVRRVEVFNAAGRSGFSYSARSATVVAAASSQPTFSQAPVITSAMGAHSGVMDVITVTPGIASDPKTGSFYADGNLVTGQTPTTFQRTMEYITASITYVEVATNASTGVSTSSSSNAIVGNPGYEEWWPALIDPMETVNMKVGTLSLTYPEDCDYLCVAGVHVTADTRTSTLETKGGRRRWVIGTNGGGKQVSSVNGEWGVIAGVSSDALGQSPGDGIAMGGTSARSDTLLMVDCRMTNFWGTRNAIKYYGVDNKATITRFERMAANEWRLEIAAPFPEPYIAGQAVSSAKKFKITGCAGHEPLKGPHFDYEVIEVLSPTAFRLRLTTFGAGMFDEFPRPAIGTNFTSGTVWSEDSVAGYGATPGRGGDRVEHVDAVGQQDQNRPMVKIIWERCTVTTAYQAARIAQESVVFPAVKIINCNWSHFTNRDPQAVTTQLFYSGKMASLEVRGTYFQCRFGVPVETYGIFVTAWVNQTGGANDWTTTTVNGQKRVTNPNMTGYIIDGAPKVDFCQRTGGAYTMPTFLGYDGPDLARFSTVTLEKGSGGPVAPGILDRIVVDYDGPEIIDWTITDIDPSILYKQPQSRRILAGPAYVAGTEYTFTVNLTPRGSGLTKSQPVTRGA